MRKESLQKNFYFYIQHIQKRFIIDISIVLAAYNEKKKIIKKFKLKSASEAKKFSILFISGQQSSIWVLLNDYSAST